MSKSSDIRWSSVTKLAASCLPAHEAHILVSRWKHWDAHKGPEWLASRCKSIWNVALIHKSYSMTREEESINVLIDNRIAHTHTGFPKGIEGVLVRRFVSAETPSVLRRLAALLRFYTCIVLKKASDSQIMKAKNSITSLPKLKLDDIPTQTFLYSFEKGDRAFFTPPFRRCGKLRWMQGYLSEKDMKIPSIGQLSGISAYPYLGKLPASFREQTPYASLMASLGTKGCIPDVLYDFWKPSMGEEISNFLKKAFIVQAGQNDFTYGKICVLQERGAKGRVICSPNAWVQLLLKPFHDQLVSLIKELERRPSVYGVSCMLDQERGIDFVRRAEENFDPVWCVDLSSATDRFPLSLQMKVAEDVGLPTLGVAFLQLRGPYLGPDGEEWTYGTGQPMGCFGSFPLFHLSHYILLSSMCQHLGLDEDEVNFCVLGDDVVIFNRSLYDTYCKTLDIIGVEISHHKSYTAHLAEFAGFISVCSYPKGKVTTFRPMKWGVGGRFPAVTQVCHGVGSRVRRWSNSWAKAYDDYVRTLGLRKLDLSPLLHDDTSTLASFNSVDPRYIASVAMQLGYFLENHAYDSEFDSDHIEFRLLQKDVESYSLGSEANVPRGIFNPEDYLQDERKRKSMWQAFYKEMEGLLHGDQSLVTI